MYFSDGQTPSEPLQYIPLNDSKIFWNNSTKFWVTCPLAYRVVRAMKETKIW